MTHISIAERLDGKTADWMEKVSDEQYNCEIKEVGHEEIKSQRLLVITLVSMFSFTAIVEAQNMDANQALSAKQQSIVTIAAFTANGDLQKLKTALNEGLDAGLTVNEIKEVLVQMYAYCGFPRA